jgi:hypothetical protein
MYKNMSMSSHISISYSTTQWGPRFDAIHALLKATRHSVVVVVVVYMTCYNDDGES